MRRNASKQRESVSVHKTENFIFDLKENRFFLLDSGEGG